MGIRGFKIMVLGVFGLLFALIAVNNISDYRTNFSFVKEVLSMESITETHVEWRAITSPPFQHASYIAIIVWEALTAAICFAGAYFLLKKTPSALKIAAFGLTMGFLLFMVGFVIIAGEWFYLWGSAAAPMHMKALLFSLLTGGAACFVMLAPDRLT